MKPKIAALLIIVFMFLVGCFWSPKPSIYTTDANTPTMTKIPPTDLTVAVEVTSLPPLSPNSAKEVLSLFVRNNGGCKLPCLMGLAPGENYKSVESFGDYFIKNTQQSNDQINGVEVVGNLDDNSGGTLLVFWDNRIRVQIGVGAQLTPDKEQIDHVTLSASVYEHFEDDNGIEFARLLQEHSYYDSFLKSFSLPAILAEYGEPTEIWIYPFPEDPGYSYKSSAYRFVFVLIYTDLGFAIEYVSIVKDEGEYLIGCPDVDNIKISTWSPQMERTINEVSQYFSGTDGLSKSNVAFFKPLQIATSLNIKDFYDTYKASNTEDGCIQTPRQLWP